MEHTTTLLIVDDDYEICELLSDLLQRYGYTIHTAHNGKRMQEQMHKHDIDLVVLDVMLPGEDGLSLCRTLRSQSSVPIIMLTANGEDTDRIIGLEMGADDYVAKPFNPRELVARIKAVLRRSQDNGANDKGEEKTDAITKIFEFAGWQLEMASRQLRSPDNMKIMLSAGEFALLTTFIQRPQRILSRDQLLELLHHRSADPFDRSIDIQVSRLRQKLGDDPKKPNIIKTVRSGGYLFAPDVEKSGHHAR